MPGPALQSAAPQSAAPQSAPALPAFLDRKLDVVLQHWLAARKGRLVPRRTDIVPAAMSACLPYVWIYRWRAERQDFENVLAGEEINYVWGYSIRGKFMDELFGDDAPVLRRRWHDLLDRPAIAYGRLTGEIALGQYRPAERLSLPLLDDADRPYGILGISIYQVDRMRAEALKIPPPLQVLVVPCRDLPGAPAVDRSSP